MPDLPALLTTKDAARVLGVSIKTVQRYAAGGTLASVNPNPRGSGLFLESDVRELAERRRAA